MPKYLITGDAVYTAYVELDITANDEAAAIKKFLQIAESKDIAEFSFNRLNPDHVELGSVIPIPEE